MNWLKSLPYGKILLSSSLTDKLAYIESLACQLSTLHSYGIIHHDVKPSNFLYDHESGKGTLIDFGTMLLVGLIVNSE